MAVLSFLVSCKLCREALLAVLLIAAALGFITYEKHKIAAGARAEAIAEMKAASTKEWQRRDQVIAEAQAQAQAAVARAQEKEKENAALLGKLDRHARILEHRDCLDLGGVRQLDQIGRPTRR